MSKVLTCLSSAFLCPSFRVCWLSVCLFIYLLFGRLLAYLSVCFFIWCFFALFGWLLACLSVVYLSACLFVVCLSVCFFVSSFVYPLVYLLFACLLYLFTCLFICCLLAPLFVYLLVYLLSACSFVCLLACLSDVCLLLCFLCLSCTDLSRAMKETKIISTISSPVAGTHWKQAGQCVVQDMDDLAQLQSFLMTKVSGHSKRPSFFLFC